MRRALLTALAAGSACGLASVAQAQFPENFDTTTAGTLPGGWSATGSGAALPWAVVNDQFNSAPNSVFTNDPSTLGSQFLNFPVINAIGPVTIDLFHRYQTEPGFDGWVIEASINGGTFTNIGQNAFRQNGYNTLISTGFSSPIGGQRAFAGTSLAWLQSVAVIPAENGDTVGLRVHMATDTSVSSVGVWLDDISVTTASGAPCCMADGTCAVLAPSACSAAGGVFNAAASCASANCPPPPPPGSETFEAVALGSLPAGWTTSVVGAGAPWGVVNTSANSGTQSVFTNDPTTTSSQFLNMPLLQAQGNVGLNLFRSFNTENLWDGWAVEASVNGGAFANIGDAAWSLNGYNATINVSANPLSGQRGFSGNFPAWTNSAASIPASNGDTVAIRFHMGADASVSSVGVWLDDVGFSNATLSATSACCTSSGCEMLTPAACAAAGGTSLGTVACGAAASCPGACCLFDGSCTFVSPAECAAQAGVFGGAGVACAAANCPQPCPAVTGEFTGLGTGTSSDANAVFGTQTTRLFRDGAPDTCALAAPGGGPIGGTFTYVKHDFMNGSPNPVCVQFQATVNCPSNNQLYPAAYVGSYDPATPSVNNVASTGNSVGFPGNPPTVGMSFNVPGNTAFSIVLAELVAGTGCATYSFNVSAVGLTCMPSQGCYANCDNSTQAPVLNVADFGCFLTRYAAGDAYANCDDSTQPPVLNVADFGCFLTKYAAGCP